MSRPYRATHEFICRSISDPNGRHYKTKLLLDSLIGTMRFNLLSVYVNKKLRDTLKVAHKR